jgi:hypothetical protein
MHQTASATYTIVIANAPPLAITSGNPPNGTATVPYPASQFSAANGTAPYTWSSTTLPPGLSLSSSGLLTGTPTTPGTYTITVTCTDSTP